MMRINTSKIFLSMLISLSVCACNTEEIKDDVQESKTVNVESTPEIFSGADKIKENETSKPEEKEQVHLLNNKATFFLDYLYINAIHTDLIFSDRDEKGNYHTWEFPEELLPVAMGSYSIYDHFKYNDQLVCFSHITDGDNGIIIYDEDLEILNKKEIVPFSPQYLRGNLVYGYSNYSGKSSIKTINLDTLEEEIIYETDVDKKPDIIINNNNEMIICEYPNHVSTSYFKYENGLLTPIFDTKNSAIIHYDDRGLYYLEKANTDTHRNLMLWDGTDIQMIEEVKTDDMGSWIFANGAIGNIIVEDDFFVTIHTLTSEPYLLIRSFDSKESIKVLLEQWPYTEADMDRKGETFSGVYYENGQVIYYFFSKKAGMLQTQTIDLKNY